MPTPLTVNAFLELIHKTSAQLQRFRDLATDAFPRAFLDILDHLEVIRSKTEQISKHMSDGMLKKDETTLLERKIEGCSNQLKSLNSLLEKYLPMQKGGELTPKAIRDVYKETDISELQKSLKDYELQFVIPKGNNS